MRDFRGITAGQYQQVLNKLNRNLRYSIKDSDIIAAIAEVTSIAPDREVMREIRTLIPIEHERIIQSFADQLARKFERQPKPRDIAVALEASGLESSRPFRADLLLRLQTNYADKWAKAAATEKKKRLTLTAGEQAMWEALQRTYNMNSDALASMLLRIFTVVTSTGKVPHSEVTYLASSLSDDELKRYAGSLNFSVKKSRKTRVA